MPDDPEHGLLARDEDLQAFLARMLTPPDPQRFGYEHSFSPNLQARIGGEVQSQAPGRGPPTVSPSVGATLGPLSLDGGLHLQQAINDSGDPYTRATPTVSAGLKVPLPDDASAEAKFTYTPDQLKMIEMAYRQKLLDGNFSIAGNYSQPTGGTPGFGVNARYSRRF
jgi:hypothetical protein